MARGGLLKEELLNLTNVGENEMKRLLTSPGSAIETLRNLLENEEYNRNIDVLKGHQIKYVLFNDCNGTIDTCRKVFNKCLELTEDISVIGIPKTMDNDI